MRNLRFSLRGAVLAGMSLVFAIPAVATGRANAARREADARATAERSGAASHVSSSGCGWDSFGS